MKALIRLMGCTGWSVSLLFPYDINRYSYDAAHLCSIYYIFTSKLEHLSNFQREIISTENIITCCSRPFFAGQNCLFKFTWQWVVKLHYSEGNLHYHYLNMILTVTFISSFVSSPEEAMSFVLIVSSGDEKGRESRALMANRWSRRDTNFWI